MRIDEVQSRLDAELARMRAGGDPGRYFCSVYGRTTQAFAQALAAGRFRDPEWVERWDVAFAVLYLDALDDLAAGRPPSGPWQVAFRLAEERPDLGPLRHLLLGMNAHINYDLPQALLAVISDGDFADPALVGLRQAEHRTSDEVLAEQVGTEDAELAGEVPRARFDRLLAPLNRWGSRRFLTESREKVWHNTRVLAAARREGPAPYADLLGELERRTVDNVDRLVAPGQVLLRLAVRGFGIRL